MAPGYDRRWARYHAASRDILLADRALWRGPGRLLEIGCGTGALLAAARPAASLSCLGMDLSEAMLSVARRRSPAPLLCGDAERLPFADAVFERLLCANMLHLSLQPAQLVLEMARVAKPGARMVISDWCGDSPFTRWMLRWLRWTGRAGAPLLAASHLLRHIASAGFAVTDARCDRCGPWMLQTVGARRQRVHML